MTRNRRDFIRGRWVSASALTPSPDGSIEIASILVQAKPDRIGEVEQAIGDVPGAEIFERDPRGKLVVVVEAAGSDPIGAALTQISLLPHVLSACLVYHVVDRPPAEAESQTS